MSANSFWTPKLKKIKRYFLYKNTYRNFFPSLIRVSRFNKEPIVICGAPRSGTTLLLSILDAHPEIFCIPFETMLLCDRPKEKRVFKNDALHILFTKLQIVLYLLAQKIPSSAKRWCEKTPSNVLNIDFILKAYKNKVKVIHIYRDGRDVVMSIHGRVSKTIVTPETWTKCVRSGIQHKNNPNVHQLKYEDLVTDFKGEVEKLMTFLNIDYNETLEKFDRVSNINENESMIDGHGYQGSFTLRPISADSVGKWKNANAKEVNELMAHADSVALLKELGYA